MEAASNSAPDYFRPVHRRRFLLLLAPVSVMPLGFRIAPLTRPYAILGLRVAWFTQPFGARGAVVSFLVRGRLDAGTPGRRVARVCVIASLAGLVEIVESCSLPQPPSACRGARRPAL